MSGCLERNSKSALAVIHRDLKPSNILFDDDGNAFISDCRKLPYEATTPLAMVVKHTTEPIPHILDINPKLPSGIESVLEKAMAKNRGLRYAFAHQHCSAPAFAHRNRNAPPPALLLPTATFTATITPVPGVGGANKIALVANKDIWVMDMKGRGLLQVTNSDQPKFDLQWLPGGKEILYGEGKCVKTVNVGTFAITTLTCLEGLNFTGFRVSPDGNQECQDERQQQPRKPAKRRGDFFPAGEQQQTRD